MIHWKYSSLMNVIFVTIMFGAGVPLLYPCALLCMIIKYCDERLCLAYYYKQPPNYTDLLSNDSLSILRWSVVVNLLFSFWMFTNQ